MCNVKCGMNLDLYVDTSRKGVSMALASACNTADGSQPRVYEEIVNPDGRGEILGASLDELLARVHATLDDVKRVMVTLGPGSFSGLRTGVAFCQGLCFSGKRELYGVTTLQALACFGAFGDPKNASGDPQQNAAQHAVAVVIRARNGFWYLRLNGEESFIETPDVVTRIKNAQVKTVVADSPAIADETLKAVFEEIGAKVDPDTGLPLDRWAPLFQTVKPSLIQEANYIQPSYFEKLNT